MGNALITSGNDENDREENSSSIFDVNVGDDCDQRKGRRKRRRLSHVSNENEETTKLIKLDTPKYVHQKLFVEGCDSDIQISALGYTWRLHRVYLEQCEYFRALFRGNWKDSYENAYTLEIVDTNITYSGLNNVFASLYNNEIEVDKEHIAGVIGAAAMLNLTSVINKCSEILSTYMSQDKILLCLRLADTYGLTDVSEKALAFLKLLFWRYSTSVSFLKELSPYWFAKILSADFLCVKENEMDVYTAMKMWIYIQNFPDECTCDVLTEPSTSSAGSLERCPHLSDNKMREFFYSDAYDWRSYVDVLRYLRVSQLTLFLFTLKTIKRDGMIPNDLIDCVMRDQWNTLLINEEATTSLDELMEDDFFYRHCFRLGRNGNSGSSRTMWRWLGCFFGTDLLVSYSSGSLRFIRNCTSVSTQNRISVKMCDSIRIHYRVIVCDEENGTPIFDSKRRTTLLEVDSQISIGFFKIPRSTFSVHVFYLASIPGPSSTFYWDNLLKQRSPRKCSNRFSDESS